MAPWNGPKKAHFNDFEKKTFITFLLRNAMLSRYIPSWYVCMCVCVCVCVYHKPVLYQNVRVLVRRLNRERVRTIKYSFLKLSKLKLIDRLRATC